MANPVVSRLSSLPPVQSSSGPMTLNGTVVRTSMLLLVCLVAAAAGYFLIPAGMGLFPFVISAVAAVAIIFWAANNPLRAKYPAFVYALVQGVLVGSVSHIYSSYAGTAAIIVQALLLTGVAVAVTLIAYVTRLVKVTEKFRSVVILATMTIAGYYLLALLLSLFSIKVPLIYNTGTVGIIFTAVVLVVACLNLFLDYSMVENAIAAHADERFEWFAALGLTVSVLWVYINILKILSLARR